MTPSEYIQKHKRALTELPYSCQNIILNCARIVSFDDPGRTAEIKQHVNRMAYKASDDIYNTLQHKHQKVAAADIARICQFKESIYAFLEIAGRKSWADVDTVLSAIISAVNRV